MTVPLPAARRLTVARTGRTFRWALWKDDLILPSDWRDGRDGSGGAGVREPRRPIAPRSGGAIALPLD